MSDDERALRESWEPAVAAMIEGCRQDEAEMRATIGFLGKLLAKDLLPTSGRAFLAEFSEDVAAGRNPFPRRPSKRREHSHYAVLANVLNECAKRNATHGDFADIHLRVGQRMGLKASTVVKSISIARSRIRSATNSFSDGSDRDREKKIIGLISNLLSLPEATIKSYF